MLHTLSVTFTGLPCADGCAAAATTTATGAAVGATGAGGTTTGSATGATGGAGGRAFTTLACVTGGRYGDLAGDTFADSLPVSQEWLKKLQKFPSSSPFPTFRRRRSRLCGALLQQLADLRLARRPHLRSRASVPEQHSRDGLFAPFRRKKLLATAEQTDGKKPRKRMRE